MLVLGNGMDAVNSLKTREFDSLPWLPFLLSPGMDAVKSLTLMGASSSQ